MHIIKFRVHTYPWKHERTWKFELVIYSILIVRTLFEDISNLGHVPCMYVCILYILWIYEKPTSGTQSRWPRLSQPSSTQNTGHLDSLSTAQFKNYKYLTLMSRDLTRISKIISKLKYIFINTFDFLQGVLRIH